MNVIFNIHTACSSNHLKLVFLSEGEARAAVVWAVPGNPHGTGVSRVLNNTGKRGCEPRGPCGKADMLKTWTRIVLLNLALIAAGHRA